MAYLNKRPHMNAHSRPISRDPSKKDRVKALDRLNEALYDATATTGTIVQIHPTKGFRRMSEARFDAQMRMAEKTNAATSPDVIPIRMKRLRRSKTYAAAGPKSREAKRRLRRTLPRQSDDLHAAQ